jgi:hypothetical protein
MSDRDNDTGSINGGGNTGGPDLSSGANRAEVDTAETGSEDDDDPQTRTAASIAPDPGDPGGMGGVRVKGGNPLHRPPGGVSPIAKDEASDG